MEQPNPRFRGYYERMRHRAAIDAMNSLILGHPEYNSTAIAIRSVELADALLKELGLTPDVEEVLD